ncbi:MazG nucleotide pyrophosphohydrolase domain-containing protein [uncultured Clostridium sp.]|uniref:MazG nucleotide pyrophosphohydrolase domain-containing protein n=1 Tax=uncultured Clostridium sp. TaxID=59620 RepID=UPI00260E5394|nr:MazG nucleotide pyrophosphohydrolase domain-containing protein [uncultured Clostridium sp.]
MCIEECSELIQALCKYKRGRQHNVEEEMADVFIMMTQMRLVFNQIEIQRIINLKVNTLKDKIQDE